MWKEFWANVSHPSYSTETSYEWATIAAGHFLIGVALAQFFPDGLWFLISAYVLFKELRDLLLGGRIVDSIVDTGFVILGALMLPLAAVGAIATGITFYSWIRKH